MGPRLLPALAVLAAVLAAMVACGGDGPVAPPTDGLCDGRATGVLSLARFEGRVIAGADVHCALLAGGGAHYLVIPQLTGADLPYGGYGFRIGDPTALPPVALHSTLEDAAAGSGIPDLQRVLDARLRERERTARPRPRTTPVLPHALDPLTLRRFSVLSTLDETPQWTPVDAQLRFAGARVAVYLDTLAADAFSDADLQEMGTLYDEILAPRVFDAFGPGSDVDANDRVLFVLSPTVNALIPAADCATRGFVRGFFYSHDLVSSDSTSNQAEVFYGFVPDPSARWSCAHSKADVLANLPPTFMHELQHMISFGAHAVVRGGPGEEPWLNEGLSHLAEELGSLYWEQRFPAPLGRTQPSQLFPDSAAPYINPNLLYSYRFLFSSAFYSLTACAPGTFCSLAERGGTWLLLRWIADQKGEATLRGLVQTTRTGRENLEAVTGETTGALLGSFAVAVSSDSLEGVARSEVPARYRLGTRNLRAIYRRLFESYGLAGGVGRPFPIAPIVLSPDGALTGTMRPGTFVTYELRTAASAPVAALRFAVPDGSAFPGASGAQVSIFRLR